MQLPQGKTRDHPARNGSPAKTQHSHFQQHEVTGGRPGTACSGHSLVGLLQVSGQPQFTEIGQHIGRDVFHVRQGVFGGHKQRDLRLLRNRGCAYIRRVTVLRPHHADLGTPGLHQRHQVAVLGNQAFKLQVRKTLLKGTQDVFEAV